MLINVGETEDVGEVIDVNDRLSDIIAKIELVSDINDCIESLGPDNLQEIFTRFSACLFFDSSYFHSTLLLI